MCSVAQSSPTLSDSMDCWLSGFSVHGLFQAWILEWVTISSSRGFSWFRDQTHISCISCISRQIYFTPEPLGKLIGLHLSLTLLPGVQHDLIFLYISALSTCCLVAFVTIRRHYAIIEWLTLFHNFTHFFFNWKSVPLNLSHLFLSSFHSHPSGNHLFVLCM